MALSANRPARCRYSRPGRRRAGERQMATTDDGDQTGPTSESNPATAPETKPETVAATKAETVPATRPENPEPSAPRLPDYPTGEFRLVPRVDLSEAYASVRRRGLALRRRRIITTI